MKPATLEWVQKAEGDMQTALREFDVRDDTNYDAVCFHAQQCAEKYLKGRLIEEDVPFPKAHALGKLLDLVLPLHPEWADLRQGLNSLTDTAIESRYPGYSTDRPDAEESLAVARRVRDLVRQALFLTDS